VAVWTDPLWLAEAHEWIDAEVARLGLGAVGAIDQHHVQPWSTVMRVPTESGDVYFKANTAALRHEAAAVSLLAAHRPDCVPPPLAVDLERGWMLMADAGDRLRETVERERDMSCWLDILPLYAGLQIDLADHADELLAHGVPDLRLSTLPSSFETMLDDLVVLPAFDLRRLERNVSRVEAMCDDLAGYGLPETTWGNPGFPHAGEPGFPRAKTRCRRRRLRCRSGRCRRRPSPASARGAARDRGGPR
jgi:hypothetical protein